MKIGFFDSGIGGLTVLGHALKMLPFADYIYYADIKHVPYGEKKINEVRQYVQTAMDYMAEINVDAVVIACNTATSVADAKLRRKYSFPIIGMEPAVKPAFAYCQERGKKILVLATSLTLREEKFRQLVNKLDATTMVDTLALGGLVKFAEKFEFDTLDVSQYLKNEFASLELSDYGAVVLGCTHFPLFSKVLKQSFTEETVFFDGSVGAINHLADILEQKGIAPSLDDKIKFVITNGKLPPSDVDYKKILHAYVHSI
ncbi:glutamate racemase [Dendrosporobacter sp. 1207_IL3150]|uniref:glutamate racemase n=1 Tax=Dendrosporobacter sp. 1207_IL3150 TaxID=3084054 RepID=UPI002FDAB5FB